MNLTQGGTHYQYSSTSRVLRRIYINIYAIKALTIQLGVKLTPEMVVGSF